MAASTFERRIVISNKEALQRLERIANEQTSKEPISKHPFSAEDRKRGEELLERCKLRSCCKEKLAGKNSELTNILAAHS